MPCDVDFNRCVDSWQAEGGVDRRRVLQGLGALAAWAQIDPDVLVSPAFAQVGRPMVFLPAENITEIGDPTAHATVSQKNIDGFVPAFPTRRLMRLADPGKGVCKLATDVERLDPHRPQINLRDSVTVHDRTPFKAEDVRATFEYGARSDRRAQGYPGPTGTLTIGTPDDRTIILCTSKGGGAGLARTAAGGSTG